MDFYYTILSAPCRSVMMTAKYLNQTLNLKSVNLTEKEHLKPEYLKINPQHCVPTLVDNGFVLWESRAIMQYLANQYAPDNDVYPKEPKKRALVDRMLYFDIGTLYKAMGDWVYPEIVFGQPAVPEKEKVLREKLELLNTLMNGSKYAAGDHITLADFTLVVDVGSLKAFDFDLSLYPNITKWLDQLEADLPFYHELNVEPVEGIKQWAETLKNKNPGDLKA